MDGNVSMCVFKIKYRNIKTHNIYPKENINFLFCCVFLFAFHYAQHWRLGLKILLVFFFGRDGVLSLLLEIFRMAII